MKKKKAQILETRKLLSFPNTNEMIAQKEIIRYWVEEMVENFIDVKATQPSKGGILDLKLRWYPDGCPIERLL